MTVADRPALRRRQLDRCSGIGPERRGRDSMLLAVRDRLPDPLVIHWDNGEPDILIGLDFLLLLTGALTIGVTALALLVGRCAAGSWRHTWATGALLAAFGLPVWLYGLAWAQRNGPVVYPPHPARCLALSRRRWRPT